jgi:hypothetical protein
MRILGNIRETKIYTWEKLAKKTKRIVRLAGLGSPIGPVNLGTPV